MRSASRAPRRHRPAAWRAGQVAAAGIVTLLAGAPASAELAPAMRMKFIEPVSPTRATSTPPTARVLARVNLSQQRMEVFVDEALVDVFPVSTGRAGFDTPPGDYHAEWIAAFWRSRKYHYAPMPWSVFFHGGYAIHGTTEVWRLGHPASHGCIRLKPDDAKVFYTLVLKNGNDSTTITVSQ